MKWSKDGDWLQQGDRVEVVVSAVSGVSELKISSAIAEDSGVYRAEASNVHGTVQSIAVVKVTKSEQGTSEHRETSVLDSTAVTEIAKEVSQQNTEESLVTEDKFVVREEKEKTEKEKEQTAKTHKMVCEVATERVEIFTDSRPPHQQTALTEIDTLGEASVTESDEIKVSKVTQMQQENTSEESAKELPASEEKVESPITDVTPQFLEITDQETVATVSDHQMLEVTATSTVTEMKAFCHDVVEQQDDGRIKLEEKIRENLVSKFIVAENMQGEKTTSYQPEDIPETSQTVEQVTGGETDVKFGTEDLPLFEEIAVFKGDVIADSSETVESATVLTEQTEVASSAEAVSKTSEAAGVKTVISKEIVTKKTRKSKDRQKKTDSKTVDITHSAEELEEVVSAVVTRENETDIKVDKSRVEGDKKDSESITVAEDTARKNVTEEVAEAEVEVIDVEYSEEEFEEPMPMITIKPLPTTIQEGEVLRLVCKVAKEPEVEISWSKDGRRLETGDARIRIVKDKAGGTYLLEIVETTTEDGGEYTLSAESEGGIVSCTVSVNVTAKVQPEGPSSTVSEETTLSTAVSERTEPDATTEESFVREKVQLMQSPVDTCYMAEPEQQTEIVVVADRPAVAEVVEVTSADDEITTAIEELVDSAETVESAVVCTAEAEIASSAEAFDDTSKAEILSDTSKAAGAKTVVSKETVTKKKKKSKDKQEKSESEAVGVIQSAEEVEEKVSEEVTTEDTSEIKVVESRMDEERKITESIGVIEDVVTKNVTEEVAETGVEVIDVEYSEEEFEGTMPVITMKPLPTTIQEGEVLRLVCKVAEEPEVEVSWSKDGRILETGDARIRTVEDKAGGTYLLEIVEMTTEDGGEYTLSAESEGGIVSCTVSVNVTANVQPEGPSSAASGETTLSTAVLERTEPDAEKPEPVQPVVSMHDTEETEQRAENIAVVDRPSVAIEPEIVEVKSADHEIAVTRDELVDSTERLESALVHTADSEVASFAAAVSDMSTAVGVEAVVSKETVTRKNKKSKDKHVESDSESVKVIQSVDETEENVAKEVAREDGSEVKVEESRVEEDKTVTESVTVVEYARMQNVAEEVAEAEVEQFDVECSEEEFEGPLPVIEVKPLPTTVNPGDTVRLVCKVADEPAAEIYWSKNSQRLEVAPDYRKVNMGVDVGTGMQFLEIAEASLDDVGEYSVTAESEGGIVTCTVSVDVVSKPDVMSVPKETPVPPFNVLEDVEQLKSPEQVSLAVDSEVSESSELLGKAQTGEVVVVDGEELQKATKAAPVFVFVPQPLCAEEGSAVRLQCRVEG